MFRYYLKKEWAGWTKFQKTHKRAVLLLCTYEYSRLFISTCKLEYFQIFIKLQVFIQKLQKRKSALSLISLEYPLLIRKRS